MTEAKKILAKMNDILRVMPITAAVKDEKFGQLQDELYDLGWLGFCMEQPSRRNSGFVQLMLVRRDSKEALSQLQVKKER